MRPEVKDAYEQFARLHVLHEAHAHEDEIARQEARTVKALVLAQHCLNGHMKPEIDLSKVATALPALLDEPDPPHAWVIDRLLEEGGGMLLYGPSYVAKSLASWYSALCVARGFGTVFNTGVEAPPAKAVVFYGENTRRQVRNAYRAFLGDEPPPGNLLLVDVHAVTPYPDLATPQGRAWYEAVVVESKARYAVLDSSTALVGADMSDGEISAQVMQFLSRLGKQHGLTRTLVHHTRKASTKGDEGSSADRAAGHANWHRLSDTCVLFDRDGPDRVKVDPWKIRDSEPGKPWIGRVDPETRRLEFVAALGGTSPRNRPKSERGEAAAKIARKLHEAMEWVTAKELAELLDVDPRSVQRSTSAAAFLRWVEAGFFEVDTPTAENAPVRYRSTGALPPELL